MATRTECYVDTSAFIAFVDRSDSHHALFARLFADPPRLITTTLVIAEGHGWFLNRYDTSRALQFLAMIEALTPLRVISVSEGAQEQRRDSAPVLGSAIDARGCSRPPRDGGS